MSDPDLTSDRILGGRVTLWQPRQGYRAGVDPVFLASAVPARAGQSVLDLGCGAGAAALCRGARGPGLRLTGVERQPLYAGLARRNATENGADLKVVQGDLTQLPEDLRQTQFDHVIANPPYFRRDASVRAENAAREGAHGEDTALTEWVDVAARRCAPRGYVTFIQRAERLPELLAGFQARLGSLELIPLIPRLGRESQLVILRGRKEGRAPFRLCAGLVVHRGVRHESDGEDYTPEARALLFDAQPMRTCG
jgi:tRNA1(Val) A37 N6-methylase TrmN6